MKISEKKIQELKITASKILAKYRQSLLNVYPFIGSIAMNLNLIPIRDKRCNTAMTDGKNIFFDIDFLSRLNENEGIFVLGHEVWHVVMMHFLRGEGLDHNTFNIATDMEVNQIMESDGFVPPVNVIFPNKNHSRICEYNFSDGLSAEEYYKLLINNKQQQKHGKKSNACEGQFDEHFDKSTNYNSLKESMSDVKMTDKYGEKEFDNEFNPGQIKSDKDIKNMAEDIRQTVISAAQSYEKFRGELPGHIKKIVDNLLEGKISWREHLSKFITAGFQNKISWNTPNRRFAWNGTYLPKHTGDMMKIAIGIDTSGSCTNHCKEFLSEINNIAKTFGSYELHVIQCDTQIQDYQVFDENNNIETAIKNIEFKGFGGTYLHPVFDYIKNNNIEVSGVLMFTDGECETFEDNDDIDIPIMWTLTSNQTAKNIKIGEQIFITND